MSRFRPFTILLLLLLGLIVFGGLTFAQKSAAPVASMADTIHQEDQPAVVPADTTSACSGGPVIDGILLDECVKRNFNVSGDAKSVTVWYTKVPVTATRIVDGNPVVLSHWINTNAQASQVAQWMEEAWQRYHTDSGHHLYDTGCGNNLNVRIEEGVGWAGIAYWGSPGSCWIGIDSGMVRAGGGQWVAYHEAQHYLQYSFDDGCYDYLRPRYPDDAEFVEGYADLGADTVDATIDASGYAGITYDPSTSMYEKSYGNLFNKYFIEQLGSVGSASDPWYHIDAMYNHYRECDHQDSLYVLDSLIPTLSGGRWSLNQFFLNFFAANWTKDWADPATQPELVYYDDDGSPYGNTAPLTKDVTLASGSQSWAGTTPDDFAASYYQVRPQAGCPYVQAEVNGATGAYLGINLMAAETTAPTRVLRSAKLGEDYVRTFAGAGVFDRIVASVNSFASTYSYQVTFTCVSPNVDIKEPRQVNYALVGAPSSPIAYLARWTVSDGSSSVRGLVESSFSFRAGSDPVTVVTGTFQEVGDEYWAVLLPPVKPAGTTFVNFTVCMDSLCDSETNALLYVTPGNTDTAITFDASGSMSTEDIIGEGTRLFNAQKAGKVVADLLRSGDRILVTDFSANDSPAGCGLPPDGSGDGNCPLDVRTLLSRRDVSAATLAARIDETRNAINTLSAREWTPIGGGVQDAKNKLLAAPFSLNPKHIYLLSDGRENVNPLYAAVKAELAASGVVINTIGFGPEAPGNLLAQMAADTGGVYRPVATTAGGAGLATAASLDVPDAPSEEIDQMNTLLSAPLLPGQLGLADVYDYFDTAAQNAARIFHVNFTNVPSDVLTWKEWSAYVDKSVNEVRFVVAGKQADSSSCNGYRRFVEVAPPDAINPKRPWIAISPARPVTPGDPLAPPATWDIRNDLYDDVLVVPNPAEGTWRIRTTYDYCLGDVATTAPQNSAALTSDFMINLSAQSTIQLEGRLLGLNHNQGSAGDVVSVVAVLLNRAGTVKGALVGTVIENVGGTHAFFLFDDGAHGDGQAGDGIYAAPFAQTIYGGSYSVRTIALFQDPTNPANLLAREWNGGFWIKGPKPDVCDKENDHDCDGMPDPWELRCKLDTKRNDAQEDPDHDNLNNLPEFQAGTLPCVADTDHGGERDGSEVTHSRNPLDPKDDKVLEIGHVNVRALNQRILIDWTRPLSYTNMLLYLSTDPNQFGRPVSMGQQGNYMVDRLQNDQTYYLRIAGVFSQTEGLAQGDYSATIAVTPKADPDPPSGAIAIAGGAPTTPSKHVVLNISSTDTPLQGAAQGANGHLTDQFSLLYNTVSGGVEMRLANYADLSSVRWQPLAFSKAWDLECANGEVCRVFAQFRDAAKNESLVVYDSILLNEEVRIYLPVVSR
ncbi:MAG: choice-of-anchor X domain-containing protein [Caldilineaceae bacterium]